MTGHILKAFLVQHVVLSKSAGVWIRHQRAVSMELNIEASSRIFHNSRQSKTFIW